MRNEKEARYALIIVNKILSLKIRYKKGIDFVH